ncbi:MAG: RNA polymerase sigma factor [Lachnospiraceae bacterium]|jgi:RNA polymerase sigma-70 factor (ECF subfamily)|nr:RNA polymerase sigma factor [Lachnospiraceae bacterium]
MSLSIVGNSADAEDMVQDTLVTWLSETPDFPDEAHEKQWLVKVVRNNSLMLIRKRKNRDRILSEQAKVSVGRDADYGILDVLYTLPDKYKAVLLLFYVEEYSVEEIATVLKKSVSAVKMRLKRGREMLSERYREKEHEG